MWLLLVLACGSANTTLEDVDELLDRIEALERQVADLGGVADVDSDGDGLRDGDGLPVGTRRGDLLFEDGCDEPFKVVTFPAWLTVPEFGYQGFYAWVGTSGADLEGEHGDLTWRLMPDDDARADAAKPIECEDGGPGDPYRNRTSWRFFAR